MTYYDVAWRVMICYDVATKNRVTHAERWCLTYNYCPNDVISWQFNRGGGEALCLVLSDYLPVRAFWFERVCRLIQDACMSVITCHVSHFCHPFRLGIWEGLFAQFYGVAGVWGVPIPAPPRTKNPVFWAISSLVNGSILPSIWFAIWETVCQTHDVETILCPCPVLTWWSFDCALMNSHNVQ